MISEREGQQLIKIARGVIEAAFKQKEIKIPLALKDKLSEKAGVFVTLEKKDELRGCIGYPEPILPLGVALIRAARAAAFEDNRFSPLRKEELDEIIIEISILTPPEKIEAKPGEHPKHIRVGQDGIIVRKGAAGGLLLPQVAEEWGWNAEQFLSQTCAKAGLAPTCWADSELEVYRFQAQIFKEKK